MTAPWQPHGKSSGLMLCPLLAISGLHPIGASDPGCGESGIADGPLAVTSWLHSPAFTTVQVGAREFVVVQSRMTFQIADSRAGERTGVHRDELPERCNFPLAKVGVEGSNPFARSNIFPLSKVADGRAFAGFSNHDARRVEVSWNGRTRSQGVAVHQSDENSCVVPAALRQAQKNEEAHKVISAFFRCLDFDQGSPRAAPIAVASSGSFAERRVSHIG
jgi:hypothetical protein